jgi:FG-GAP repeat
VCCTGRRLGLTRTGGQRFTQAPEQGDLFGYALAAADFNHNGFTDLAASAPGEKVGSIVDTGAVSVLFGATGGLSRTGGQLFTQVGSAPEPGDRFGTGLAAGAPGP